MFARLTSMLILSLSFFLHSIYLLLFFFNIGEYDAKRRRQSDGGFVRSPTQRRHPGGVEEKTECYKIVSSRTSLNFEMTEEDLNPVEVNNEERMRSAGYAAVETVDKLWEQKNRMDKLFDDGRGDLYYKERDYQFPQDRRGSSKFANRAGDKLWQVHCAVEGTLFDPLIPESSFFDICGGPGAFSQLLLDKFSELRNGFGMTLRVPMTNTNEYWYRGLENHERFHIVWGKDDQGDVYVPENLDQATLDCSASPVSVVVSDGGFKIQKMDDKHMENLQELFSGRIILSEFTLMMKILCETGHFVVKLFDSFSDLTVSLIYLATLVFEEVYVVKPVKSRIVNSERYLAGKRRRPESETLEFCRQLLSDIHAKLYQHHLDNPNKLFSPLSVIPIRLIKEDATFMECITHMNEELADKQTRALKQIMDPVEEASTQVDKLDAMAQRFGLRK